MMENSASLRSLESIGRPSGTGRSPNSPFSSATRTRREGRSVEQEPHAAGGRRRASAEKNATHTKRQERRWKAERAQGDRREARADSEASRSDERWKAQRAEKQEQGAGRTRAAQDAKQPGAQRSDSGHAAGFGGQLDAARGHASTAKSSALSSRGPLDGPASEVESGEPVVLQTAFQNPLTPTAQRLPGGAQAAPGAQATRNIAAAQTSGSNGSRQAQPAQAALVPAAATGEVRAQEARTKASTPSPATPEMAAQDSEQAAEVLRQFRLQLHPGLKTAVIQLAPAELGKIRIEMKIEGGKVRAMVRAEKPEALAALEAHLPELRAALEQQGLVADDLQLGLGFEGGDGSASHERAGASAPAAASAVEPDIDHASLARAVARRAGVDFYA